MFVGVGKGGFFGVGCGVGVGVGRGVGCGVGVGRGDGWGVGCVGAKDVCLCLNEFVHSFWF